MFETDCGTRTILYGLIVFCIVDIYENAKLDSATTLEMVRGSSIGTVNIIVKNSNILACFSNESTG